MKLYHAAASPFARKVRIVAACHNLSDRLELVAISPMDEALRAVNPFGQVPALVLDDGMALYDSPVICRYLDHLGGGGLTPPPGDVLGDLMEALGDGINDAAVRRVMQERRPEDQRQADVIARANRAVAAGLERAEAMPLEGAPSIGRIALLCALGYLDFRLPELDWRASHPRLAAWFATVQDWPMAAPTDPVRLAA
jgi:glutathione S-transferase